MAVTGAEGVLLLVARALFGGVLAFMGLNHFLDTEAMAGYARQKGLPAPTASVLASGALLVLGGLGIVVGAFPVVSAVAIAAFLLASGVLMHDFWAVEGEQRQEELTHFLKNVIMAGGALALGAVASQGWTLGLGVGLV